MAPEEIFLDEYDRTVEEIRRDLHRAHFAELVSTQSPSEWARMKSWVLVQAAHQPPLTSQSRHAVGSHAPPAAGVEMRLESLTLRLKGRADRIRQLGPHVFEVRDFKTGAILDDQGEIKQEIALQLQAYGLLLIERRPDAEVRLVVDNGDEREVPFDSEERRIAKDELKRIADSMPPSGRASANDLADPGQCCFGCPIRPLR
jgi:RecB family exonuclease